jgi:VWFA-related protein
VGESLKRKVRRDVERAQRLIPKTKQYHMKNRRPYFLLGFLISGHFLLVCAQTSNPPSNHKLISLRFGVIDQNKRVIPNLRKDEIKVSSDGTPRDIIDFRLQTNVPSTMAILFDNSRSMEQILPVVKAASLIFVDGFVQGRLDQVAILSGGPPVLTEQGLTDDLKVLRAAIEGVKYTPPPMSLGVISSSQSPQSQANQTDPNLIGSTGLWDAIAAASNTLSGNVTSSQKALIIFTDGVDTSSRITLNAAIDQAIKYDIAIFAIGVADRKNWALDPEGLKKMAQRTGGRAFFPKKIDEFSEIFSQIDHELRSRYVITFRSDGVGNKKDYRQVKVEIVSPARKEEKLELAYQHSYFLKDDSK